MIRFLAAALTFSILFFVTCPPAFCHKMRVFAYGEGNLIIGEAAFAGGKNAINIEILVEDSSSGKMLLTARTDDKGQFQFPIPDEARANRLNLRIIANAGAGHRAEWPLEAADYLLSAPAETIVQKPVSKKDPQDLKELQTKEPATEPGISEERLRAIVDDSVSRQLAPLRRYLAENSERKMSFQDILGGIGYIIGLAGMAAYIKSRKKGESHDQ